MKTITVEVEDETFEWMTEYARERHIPLGNKLIILDLKHTVRHFSFRPRWRGM